MSQDPAPETVTVEQEKVSRLLRRIGEIVASYEDAVLNWQLEVTLLKQRLGEVQEQIREQAETFNTEREKMISEHTGESLALLGQVASLKAQIEDHGITAHERQDTQD